MLPNAGTNAKDERERKTQPTTTGRTHRTHNTERNQPVCQRRATGRVRTLSPMSRGLRERGFEPAPVRVRTLSPLSRGLRERGFEPAPVCVRTLSLLSRGQGLSLTLRLSQQPQQCARAPPEPGSQLAFVRYMSLHFVRFHFIWRVMVNNGK